MFLGTHAPRLDEKGRLILPARFREELADGGGRAGRHARAHHRPHISSNVGIGAFRDETVTHAGRLRGWKGRDVE